MSRREAILSAGLVFLIGLGVRAVFAAQIIFPQPEDTAYYVGAARNLLAGRGLVSDAIWSYGTPPLIFPRPAFEVWLPLPTWLAAGTMALFGTSFAAAQVSSVLVGSLIPPLTWWLAREVASSRNLSPTRTRSVALGAGLIAAVYLPLILHSTLPDSTMPFAVLGLAAAILMAYIIDQPSAARLDGRLIALGLTLGLAALTRNEAIWLALTWVLLAGTARGRSAASRVGRIGVVAVVAMLVFAPWALREQLVFGSPLPGQALTNALSLEGRDIFAWARPPTLERYLAAGPVVLLGLRVTGVVHNLVNVLLVLGMPISLIGLIGAVRLGRVPVVRPLLVFSVLTFLSTSLLFPVSTTWGTFLHAAGPVHVLLILSTVFALDSLAAWLAVRRAWTRPVAWLGPVLGVTSALLFTVAVFPSFGTLSRETAALYAELGRRMAAAGHRLEPGTGPVISNHPIWIAETAGVSALALPDEPPAQVLDLATAFPGTRLVIVTDREHRHWPRDIEAGVPGSECFRRIDLGPPMTGDGPDPLADVTAYEIACP